MRQLKLFVLVLFCVSTSLASARSYSGKAFVTADMNPYTMNYGTPPVSLGADLPAGSLKLGVSLNYANSMHKERKGAASKYEYLFFDYEMSRTAIELAYGLSEDWNVRLEIPFFAYGGGSLDSAINNYHQRFGFSEGVRPKYKNNNFKLQYANAQGIVESTTANASGIGDTRLMLMRSISTAYEDSLSYGVLLKAPTGNADKLLGSGSYDAAIWLNSTNHINRYWSHYAGIGGVFVEPNAGLLADMRRNAYGVISYGLLLHANRFIDFRAQLEYRSSIYKSATKILGNSTTLALGGSVNFGYNIELDLALVEDVVHDTAPDVNFYIQLSKKFGR